MTSPFPGMDPYLEGEMWQEFHDTLANAIRTQLMPALQPKYVALLAKRYVMDRPVMGILGLEPGERAFYPDVHVVQAEQPARAGSGSPLAVAEPSAVVYSVLDEEVPVLSVEIRDIANRRLVTVIEILSPVNKRGEGGREYLERRQHLLRTQTHLLEIDLLRQGGRIPVEGYVPPAPYYVYLSRFQQRPRTELWAIPLRDPLPSVPVPLLPPDPDVTLDLQAAVDACFELVGYERLLDYQHPPPLPPFAAEDAAWIVERLQAAGHGDGLSSKPN